MEQKHILLGFVRTDPGTQARAKLDGATVEEYAQAITENDRVWPFPPVVIFFDGEKHWLADGFHRVSAARRLQLDSAPSLVYEGSRRDAVLFAAGANAEHGLKRSQEDKRKAVLVLLNDEEWGTWADREIARQCRVSHTFVANVRKEVTGNVASDLQARTYVNKQGDTAVMKTGNIGARPSGESVRNGEQQVGTAVPTSDPLAVPNPALYNWLENYRDDKGRTWRDLTDNQVHHGSSPCYQEFERHFPLLHDKKAYLKRSLARLRQEAALDSVRNGEQAGTAVPEQKPPLDTQLATMDAELAADYAAVLEEEEETAVSPFELRQQAINRMIVELDNFVYETSPMECGIYIRARTALDACLTEMKNFRRIE